MTRVSVSLSGRRVRPLSLAAIAIRVASLSILVAAPAAAQDFSYSFIDAIPEELDFGDSVTVSINDDTTGCSSEPLGSNHRIWRDCPNFRLRVESSGGSRGRLVMDSDEDYPSHTGTTIRYSLIRGTDPATGETTIGNARLEWRFIAGGTQFAMFFGIFDGFPGVSGIPTEEPVAPEHYPLFRLHGFQIVALAQVPGCPPDEWRASSSSAGLTFHYEELGCAGNEDPTWRDELVFIDDDFDRDGIVNDDDRCQVSLPELEPTIGRNGFYVSDPNGVFVSTSDGSAHPQGTDLSTTSGCNCADVADRLRFTRSAEFYGCSNGLIERFLLLQRLGL